MKRPQTLNGSTCAIPDNIATIALLGGARYGNVTITISQQRAFERLYGFDLASAAQEARQCASDGHKAAMEEFEAAKAKAPEWQRRDMRPPKPPDLDAAADFAVSGSVRNMFRDAAADGLRLAALIARFVKPGDDPVRVLAGLMIDAGWDVGVDPAWVYGEVDDG